MKPNWGDHELEADEFAASNWVIRRGNRLYVVDSLFRGTVFDVDKQFTEAIQFPATYFEAWGWKGKFIEQSIFQMSFIMTNIFSVECAPSVCYLLHLMTPLNSPRTNFVIYSYFVLLLLSQAPKFFFWRNRPWRMEVGKVFKKDKTSGWPSRTVLQSIAGVTSLMVKDFDDVKANSWYCMLYLTTILALLVSYSRIYIGAHFFSDCVCGAIFAWALTFFNYYTFRAFEFLVQKEKFKFWWHKFGFYYEMLGIAVFFVFMHNILMRRNVNFWEKGSTIFGTLAGLFLGRLEMIRTSSVFSPMEVLNMKSIIIGGLMIACIAIINELLGQFIKEGQKFIPRLVAFVGFMMFVRFLIVFNLDIQKDFLVGL